MTNITKTRLVITTQTGIDHIYVDSEHADLCMGFATYEVFEVTSHKLLFTRIKDVWIRPIAGKVPKSSYSILPSYLFDSNICDFDVIMEKTLLEVIGPASSKFNNFGKEINWVTVYDHLFLVLIPQLAWKYNKAFRIAHKQKMNAANINLRNIVNKGKIAADDYQSLADFIEIREELNKLSIFDKYNRLDYAKHFGVIKEAMSVEDLEEGGFEYFKSKEEHDNIAKIIPGFVIGEGKTITSAEKITDFVYNVYKKKCRAPLHVGSFKVRREKILQFLVSSKIKKIDLIEASRLHNEYLYHEVLAGINSYSKHNDSSPGGDGIPAAFFLNKMLMPFVVKIIMGILNYARTNGKFPSGLMTVYDRLLHKKNKSNMVLNGYRVISLMVICLRILSAIMARRLFTTPRHNNWGISEGICAY